MDLWLKLRSILAFRPLIPAIRPWCRCSRRRCRSVAFANLLLPSRRNCFACTAAFKGGARYWQGPIAPSRLVRATHHVLSFRVFTPDRWR